MVLEEQAVVLEVLVLILYLEHLLTVLLAQLAVAVVEVTL